MLELRWLPRHLRRASAPTRRHTAHQAGTRAGLPADHHEYRRLTRALANACPLRARCVPGHVRGRDPLLPDWRGRGIGWRAQAMLCDYLFTHTPAERIQATTHPENIAEQKSLEKAGFTVEGVLRAVEFRAGHWRDGWMYSRLRNGPPPAIHRAMGLIRQASGARRGGRPHVQARALCCNRLSPGPVGAREYDQLTPLCQRFHQVQR